MRANHWGMAVIMLAVGVSCSIAQAQESLLGKYSGSYERRTNRGDERYGVELNLTSIENGAVKGSAVRHGRQCPGTYPMEGTLSDNRLTLKSGKGGNADDCSANMRLTVEGDKLKGTLGNTPIELSR